MKKLAIVLGVIMLFSAMGSVFAFGGDPVLKDPGYNTDYVSNNITSKAKDIWKTISVLVQIASVACIVFAGLRYMFTSADQKADIKQGLIFLTIGAVLVFGATLIIDFVARATEQIL